MIPVFSLSRQHQLLAEEFQHVLTRIITRDRYILGDEVVSFEKEFAPYIGTQYAVGVASGTDAITLALMALDIHAGDEVILPANAYPSVFGVSALGAIPVLVDIDPLTYTIDPDKIRASIHKKTKAIMPVHLYGQAANMEKILEIAKEYDLPVVEDCAQAVGATFRSTGDQTSRERRVGSIGKVGCYSFYPTKNLGALGDGGMVVTNDPQVYERVRMLRMYGEKDRYQSISLGRNSRLDELQAGFLRVKLKHLDEWVKRRRVISTKYKEIRHKQIELPFETERGDHSYHLFVVRCKERDMLRKHLETQGIGTGIHYPVPIHLVESYGFLGHKNGDFPESERACREVLSLPMWPELTDYEVREVINAVNIY